MTPAGYVDFEFNLPEALLARLVEVLDDMDSGQLLSGNIDGIPDAQGVYQLFFDGELVYIGKTDAKAGLSKRLERHGEKIQHRSGLDPARVTFKAVRIYVFTAVDLETQLIHHYGGLSRVRWNGSGFGSNDPGRERDTTTYKAHHFDVLFPIDIERPLDLNLPLDGTAARMFATLKENLPYVFRIQNARRGFRQAHADLEAATLSIVAGKPLTARRVIEEAVGQLPPGWQATRLPSHLILYKEKRSYPQGEVIARSK